LLKPAAGIVLVVGGIVLCFIPGPGLPLIVVGAGLLGDEWQPVARAMDRIEFRVRKGIAWACRWWNRAPKTARHALVVMAILAVGGAAYGGYRFISSH